MLLTHLIGENKESPRGITIEANSVDFTSRPFLKSLKIENNRNETIRKLQDYAIEDNKNYYYIKREAPEHAVEYYIFNLSQVKPISL
jgi:hypothetical protein